MSRELPIEVHVISDWRGHKAGKSFMCTDHADLAFIESRPDVFSFNGAGAAGPAPAPAEPEPVAEEKPKRGRKPKQQEAPAEES